MIVFTLPHVLTDLQSTIHKHKFVLLNTHFIVFLHWLSMQIIGT